MSKNNIKKIAITVLLFLAPAFAVDFNITTTADFDLGFKSNNSGNYEIETYTDNLNILPGIITLSNSYSDRFTYPDIDANTYKWKRDISGNPLTDEKDIDITVADNLHFRVEYNTSAGAGGYIDTLVFSNTKLSGDFDIQTNFSNYSCEGYDSYMFFGAYGINDAAGFPSYPFYLIGRSTENIGKEEYYTTYDYLLLEQVATTDTNGRLRITRTTTGVDEVTWRYYYWNVSTWVLNGEAIYDTIGFYPEADDDIWVGYWIEATDNADEVITNFGEFTINSGTMVANESATYRALGNWTSANITLTPGKILSNITLLHSGIGNGQNITKVQVLAGGKALFNYTTQIINGTSTTLNLTENITNDFQLRIWFAGNSTNSPVIEEIYGYYAAETLPTYADVAIPISVLLAITGIVFTLVSLFLREDYGFLKIMFLILALTTILTSSYIVYQNAIINTEPVIAKLLYRYWFGILFLLAFTFVIWLMLWLERVKELMGEIN